MKKPKKEDKYVVFRERQGKNKKSCKARFFPDLEAAADYIYTKDKGDVLSVRTLGTIIPENEVMEFLDNKKKAKKSPKKK